MGKNEFFCFKDSHAQATEEETVTSVSWNTSIILCFKSFYIDPIHLIYNMYMCNVVCACVRARACVCGYACTDEWIDVCVSACAHACMHACMFVWMCVHYIMESICNLFITCFLLPFSWQCYPPWILQRKDAIFFGYYFESQASRLVVCSSLQDRWCLGSNPDHLALDANYLTNKE